MRGKWDKSIYSRSFSQSVEGWSSDSTSTSCSWWSILLAGGVICQKFETITQFLTLKLVCFKEDESVTKEEPIDLHSCCQTIHIHVAMDIWPICGSSYLWLQYPDSSNTLICQVTYNSSRWLKWRTDGGMTRNDHNYQLFGIFNPVSQFILSP